MNRFFRSALFPLIIIAALVWLALQTLGGSGQKTTAWTTSQAYQQIRDNPQQISAVTIDPNKQSLQLVVGDKKYSVHYATPQSEAAIEQVMLKKNVDFNSKGVGSSPWWERCTSSAGGGAARRRRSSRFAVSDVAIPAATVAGRGVPRRVQVLVAHRCRGVVGPSAATLGGPGPEDGL